MEVFSFWLEPGRENRRPAVSNFLRTCFYISCARVGHSLRRKGFALAHPVQTGPVMLLWPLDSQLRPRIGSKRQQQSTRGKLQGTRLCFHRPSG